MSWPEILLAQAETDQAQLLVPSEGENFDKSYPPGVDPDHIRAAQLIKREYGIESINPITGINYAIEQGYSGPFEQWGTNGFDDFAHMLRREEVEGQPGEFHYPDFLEYVALRDMMLSANPYENPPYPDQAEAQAAIEILMQGTASAQGPDPILNAIDYWTTLRRNLEPLEETYQRVLQEVGPTYFPSSYREGFNLEHGGGMTREANAIILDTTHELLPPALFTLSPIPARDGVVTAV